MLLTIAVGTFVSVQDQTAVSLAMPPLADHFGAAIPVVQWVALGYILTTGSLLLPMGRLSDLVGRKTIYVAGFSVFVAGALLAGSAPALLALIGFRILQGVGAAMVQANAMAILTSTYPASEHGKVIGLYITMVGLGAIAGPIVGGTVVDMLGWRAVFFMSAPLGVVSLVSAITVLDRAPPADPADQLRSGAFDWMGALLSAAALVIFLLAMTNAYRIGWTSPWVVSAFAATVALSAAFLYWETRCNQPMLPLELFRRKLFSLGSSAGFFSFLAGTSVYFLIPFYLQDVIDLSPARAGLVIGPTSLCFALLGPISGNLSDRYGSKRFEVIGLILLGASLLYLSGITEETPLYLIIAALAVMGSGMGTFYGPNASSVLSVVERSRYGVATAYLNMVRNTANVTGIGLATTIVTARMAQLGFEPSLDAVAAGGSGAEGAFMEGLGMAFFVLGAFILLALALTVLKSRKPTGSLATPARSPSAGDD